MVIEFVVLYERDGGFGGLLRHLSVVGRDGISRFRICGLHGGCGRCGLRLLHDDDLLAEAHDRTDDDAQPHLADDLEAAFEALLVFAEYFDVVVGEAQQAEPHGGYDHELDIDVAQVAEEYDRHEHRAQDDHAAHRRGAAFFHLALQAEVADLFADLVAAEPFDDLLAENGADEQREYDRTPGAERKVTEQTRPRQVEVGSEVFEQGIEHLSELVLRSCRSDRKISP